MAFELLGLHGKKEEFNWIIIILNVVRTSR
jgi:hypothetical protein